MPSTRRRRSIFSFSPRAVERVLEHVGTKDLWDISQLSKRAETFIRAYNRLDRNGSRLTVMLKDSIVLELSAYRPVQWCFYGKRDPGRFCLEKLEQRRLTLHHEADGSTMSIDYCQESEKQFGCVLNSIEEVLKFIEYITDLFNSRGLDLVLDIKEYDWVSEYSSSKLEYLEVIQSIEMFRNCQTVLIHRGTVSHNEMRRILGGWSESLEKLHILCHSEPNFHYDRVISVNVLSISGGTWLTGSMLLQLELDCETVCLDTLCLTNEDINQWMKQWMNSSCKKLKHLGIEREHVNLEAKDCYEDTWRCREAVQKEAFYMDKITAGLSEYAVGEPGLYEREFRRKTDGRRIHAGIFEFWRCFLTPRQYNFYIEFICESDQYS